MVHYKSNVSSFETYKHSNAFKRSTEGFDGRAYKSWKECFDTHVIPLVIKVESQSIEILELKKQLEKLNNKDYHAMV